MDRILLHIPHSSKVFPEGRFDWDSGIDVHIERWTDKYTDKLFRSVNESVYAEIFPYSRFYCDVERLIDDPLNAVGQGIVYTRFEGVKRNLDKRHISEIMELYNTHIGNICRRLQRWVDEGLSPLLIDCHSFPRDLSDVDICIGFNDDWSRPADALLDLIICHFKEWGLTVRCNTPYSNSLAPAIEGKYPSIMIEINKKIYLNNNDETDPFAYKKHLMLESLYKKILNYNK